MSGICDEPNNGYEIFFDLLRIIRELCIERYVGIAVFPVSRYFDGKMISCDVKTVKPNPDIYRRFTEKFSLVPEECLFTDDSSANVAAAVACGWKGIVFHGSAEELERKMKDFQIRI